MVGDFLLTVTVTLILTVAPYVLLRHRPSPTSSSASCACRNHRNEPIDWFIIYKLPRLVHSVDPLVANGTGYIYVDSSSSLDQWHFAAESITSNRSLIGLTLSPLYQSNDSTHLFYNDQPPNQADSLVHGHSKGVLAFDEVMGKGFWIIHSVPHFPLPVEQGYLYPDSGLGSFATTIDDDLFSLQDVSLVKQCSV